MNLVHESTTVATLAPYAQVEAEQMLATVKIIPLAAPASAVDEVMRIAGEGGPLVRVAPFVPKRIAMIQTRLPTIRDKVLDKTVEITRRRIDALGAELIDEWRCCHEEGEVAEAVGKALAAKADIVLIAGASAIVDRRDVLPAGIERAGGTVDHFGMPVDPGNLILLAHHGEVPVLGLPGCARSPKVNGFDWVLERLVADVPVSPRDVMLMGAGGLLAEIATRPQPRAGKRKNASAQRAPTIAAVVLAAGRSSRMGAENKLLQPVHGKPMLTHVLDALDASKAGRIVVVTGHEREAVEALLEGRHVETVHNPDYAEGTQHVAPQPGLPRSPTMSTPPSSASATCRRSRARTSTA